MKKIILILFILICGINTYSIATEGEIIESQKKALNIQNFIKEANKYTEKTFNGLDTEELIRRSYKRKHKQQKFNK